MIFRDPPRRATAAKTYRADQAWRWDAVRALLSQIRSRTPAGLMMPGWIAQDYVDEVPAGAGYLPPATTRRPRSAPFEPDGVLEAREHMVHQLIKELWRLMFYVRHRLTFFRALAKSLIRRPSFSAPLSYPFRCA
jgi:hypothetical protein